MRAHSSVSTIRRIVASGWYNRQTQTPSIPIDPKGPANMKFDFLACTLAAALACASTGAFAEDTSPDATAEAASPSTAPKDAGPDYNGERLTGDWNGARSALYLQGVDIGLTLKNDIFANTHGGMKTGGGNMAHAEARLTLDLEKLLGWESSTAFFLYHSNLGSQINQDYVGAFMGVDNIEVGANTAQFYDAWIQKSFFDDNLSVLFGLYPVDSEFYVTETSGLFLQPPYGMANEVAQSGVNGPPIFPLGALAVRIKFTTSDKRFYAMGAVTDGVPGDPNNPHGTHIKLDKGDGSLAMVEFGYTPHEEAPTGETAKSEGVNKTAVGFWRYSAKFADLSGPDSHKSQGASCLPSAACCPSPAILPRGWPVSCALASPATTSMSSTGAAASAWFIKASSREGMRTSPALPLPSITPGSHFAIPAALTRRKPTSRPAIA